MNAPNPTLQRLEEQIRWYDRRSLRHQHAYKIVTTSAIVLAALIPFLAALPARPWIVGGLGVVIVLLQGVGHVWKFHENWISYRSTCEALKHEKFLHLAQAGPYQEGARDRLLAERIEGLVSREHTQWLSSRRDAARPPEPRTEP